MTTPTPTRRRWVSDAEHAALSAEWATARAAADSADRLERPAADRRYRAASDALNHANRRRDFGLTETEVRAALNHAADLIAVHCDDERETGLLDAMVNATLAALTDPAVTLATVEASMYAEPGALAWLTELPPDPFDPEA